MAVLTIDPPIFLIPTAGGTSVHHFINPGAARVVFSVLVDRSAKKSYSIKPIFGFVKSGAVVPLKITRAAGLTEDEKVLIQFTEAKSKDVNALELCKRGPVGEIFLPVIPASSSTPPGHNFVQRKRGALVWLKDQPGCKEMKPHKAKGLCGSCYGKSHYANKPRKRTIEENVDSPDEFDSDDSHDSDSPDRYSEIKTEIKQEAESTDSQPEYETYYSSDSRDSNGPEDSDEDHEIEKDIKDEPGLSWRV